MKHRTLAVGAGVALATVLSTTPAWARADSPTATETCGGATTAVVDGHAATSLEAADQQFNFHVTPVLGISCDTQLDPPG
jgi:hypothetical protein